MQEYEVLAEWHLQKLLLCNSNIAGPSGHAVCGRSPAEIVGSIPTRGMGVCL
jgi:hypothetical protein